MSKNHSKRRKKDKNDPVDIVASSMEMVSAFVMILNEFEIQVNYVRYGSKVENHPVDIDFVAVSEKGANLLKIAGAVARERIEKKG